MTSVTGLTGLVLYVLFAAIFFYVLYLVVRAAVLSALRRHADEERAKGAPQPPAD